MYIYIYIYIFDKYNETSLKSKNVGEMKMYERHFYCFLHL